MGSWAIKVQGSLLKTAGQHFFDIVTKIPYPKLLQHEQEQQGNLKHEPAHGLPLPIHNGKQSKLIII